MIHKLALPLNSMLEETNMSLNHWTDDFGILVRLFLKST